MGMLNRVGNDRQPQWFTHEIRYRNEVIKRVKLGTIDNLNGLLTTTIIAIIAN